MAGLSGPDGEGAARWAERRRARSESGSTLVELLIATAIMGLAVVSILVGSSVTFTTSAANRQSTTAGIVARDYAEALDLAVAQSGAWCSSTPLASPYTVVYTPPANYTVAVTYIDPCPAASAPQFQRVTITVTQQNRGTETLKTVVREP